MPQIISEFHCVLIYSEISIFFCVTFVKHIPTAKQRNVKFWKFRVCGLRGSNFLFCGLRW